MKKRYLLIIFLSLPIYTLGMHPSWVKEKYLHPSSQMTDSILKRYYILTRLSHHLAALQEYYIKNGSYFDAIYNALSLVHFDHPLLKSAQNKIDLSKNLTHFFHIFDCYKKYHYIDDPSITREILTVIYMITHMMNETIHTTIGIENFDTQELLSAAPTHIVYRFYVLNRIKTLITHILQTWDEAVTQLEPLNNGSFKQTEIHDCIERILQLKNLKPYTELYTKLTRYYYLDNFQLQYEFLILTCVLMQCTQKKFNNNSLRYLRSLSFKNILDYLNTEELNQTFKNPSVQESTFNYTNATLSDILTNEHSLTETEFCNFVLRRDYCINRLSFMDNFPLTQKTFHTSALKLRPLLADWKKFKRYMFLSEQLIIDDFSQEIFLLTGTHAKPHPHVESYDVIQKKLMFPLSDVKPLIDMDSIAMRWYHINRLESAHKKLKLFAQKTLVCQDNQYNFEHPVIQDCCTQMQRTQSLAPFLLLSQKFTSYFYISDELFLREYLMLLAQCKTCLINSLQRNEIKKK